MVQLILNKAFNVAKGGEFDDQPCKMLMMSLGTFGGKCTADIAGVIKNLRGLDRIMVLEKVKMLKASIGKGKYGDKTGTMEMEMTLAGLDGLKFDVDSSVWSQDINYKPKSAKSKKAGGRRLLGKHATAVSDSQVS